MSKSTATTSPLVELRSWMAFRHLDALYVSRPVSIAYLTGFFADPHERLMGLAIDRDRATLVVPALERQKAEGRATNAEVSAWRDGEDPYALVAEALGGAVEIGVEKDHLCLLAAELITTRTGASELVDVGPEIKRLRLLKEEEEIESLRHAARLTDAAYRKVLERIEPGRTEIEVALMIGSIIGELGGTLAFPSLVQSGPNSALPHLEPSSRKLEQGDLVLLDFGAAHNGYRADCTRMVVIGDPTAEQTKIHRIVLEAHDAAIGAVRPGVTTGEVDAAARRVIEAAGYGEQFFHRVGHGLGLEDHEDPSMDPGSTTALKPGMVFTIEPGIYIPGWGGVRIEDDVVVTDTGYELLPLSDPQLRPIH